MQNGFHKEAALRLCLAAFAAAIAVSGTASGKIVSFGGEPLARSVRNEADAAIDRACAWLASQQSQDGSWCESIKATAVCLLALAGSGEELSGKEEETIRRGLEWLKGSTASGEASPESEVWRDMALAVLAPDALMGPFAPIPCPVSTAMPLVSAIRERAALLGIDADVPQGPDALAAAPGGIASLARLDAKSAWWFAHAANRTPEYELPSSPEQNQADWRGSLANAWTVSQRMDERGRGFWEGSLEETAFAVLLLKEL